jgi:DNA-binding transcriptional LysR family regulator
MELRQLRYFVAVAEELHFGRAAARLHLATPSLSQQLKALERDLGVRLLDRSSTGVTLTPAGAELLPLARRTLAAADEVGAAARRVAAGRATVLRLGFLAFALTGVSRALVTEFGRAAPTVTVQLRQFEWDDPSGGLLSGVTDAALVRLPFRGSERLHTLELARDRLLVVVPDGHPLAARAEVGLDELLGEPWLEAADVTDPDFADFWYLRSRREPGSAVPSSAGTVEEWLAAVALGRGINLVPEGLAAGHRRTGLRFVPVTDPGARSPLVLAWPREDPTPAALELARFCAARRGPA